MSFQAGIIFLCAATVFAQNTTTSKPTSARPVVPAAVRPANGTLNAAAVNGPSVATASKFPQSEPTQGTPNVIQPVGAVLATPMISPAVNGPSVVPSSQFAGFPSGMGVFDVAQSAGMPFSGGLSGFPFSGSFGDLSATPVQSIASNGPSPALVGNTVVVPESFANAIPADPSSNNAGVPLWLNSVNEIANGIAASQLPPATGGSPSAPQFFPEMHIQPYPLPSPSGGPEGPYPMPPPFGAPFGHPGAQSVSSADQLHPMIAQILMTAAAEDANQRSPSPFSTGGETGQSFGLPHLLEVDHSHQGPGLGYEHGSLSQAHGGHGELGNEHRGPRPGMSRLRPGRSGLHFTRSNDSDEKIPLSILMRILQGGHLEVEYETKSKIKFSQDGDKHPRKHHHKRKPLPKQESAEEEVHPANPFRAHGVPSTHHHKLHRVRSHDV